MWELCGTAPEELPNRRLGSVDRAEALPMVYGGASAGVRGSRASYLAVPAAASAAAAALLRWHHRRW